MNNPNFADKQLLRDIAELFFEKPEAISYLHLYGQHCEIVDDNVDEEKSVERIEEQARIASDIAAHPYWQKNYYALWCVERLIHNTYFDSVKWEKSEEEWKRRDAKALSHCGYNMLFAVILIEFGADTLKNISLRFREHAHLRHLND